jgi:hypothetical protein
VHVGSTDMHADKIFSLKHFYYTLRVESGVLCVP